MARPKSPEKQSRLLRAATHLIATQGLCTSTAAIAKMAEVAEGTLFRYFANKDRLLSAVFDDLLGDLRASLESAVEPQLTEHQQARRLWDSYIEWGLRQPAAHAALNQLLGSGKLSPAQIDEAARLCRQTLGLLPLRRFQDLGEAQGAEFTDALLNSIAASTVGLSCAHPDLKEAYKNASFEILWKGVTQVDVLMNSV